MGFARNRKNVSHLFRALCLAAASILIPIGGFAGTLDSPAAPTDATSAMYSLESLYNRLNDGSAGAKRTGAFTEPAAAPGSTGHTLDEIMAKMPAEDNVNGAAPADVASGKTYWGLRTDGSWGLQTGTSTGGGGGGSTYPAPVAKTGLTTSYSAGDDGSLQLGAAPTGSRFADNVDGTVTDNLTGLIWLEDANCSALGPVAWDAALTAIAALASGSCGLTDGSAAGDWRLPNVKELQSLVDFGAAIPALSAEHPFVNFQNNYYWSSTTVSASGASTYAWSVGFNYGDTVYKPKTNSLKIIAVRGGM